MQSAEVVRREESVAPIVRVPIRSMPIHPMTEETHYQVLGVHPEASQSVIDAAYRRLVRIHRAESSLSHFPGERSEADLERIETAYHVLRNPSRRHRYDIQIHERNESDAVEVAYRAQQQAAESGAWLSEQRREDGQIVFYIGWASDFTAVRNALSDRIPTTDREFDPEQQEWRISSAYESVLAELFDNYEVSGAAPAARLTAPVYRGPDITPSVSRIAEPWTGWPLLIVAGLALAIVLTLLFPTDQQSEQAASATATTAAGAIIDALPQAATGEPTPTIPDQEPAGLLSASPLYPSVHVRAAPSTDADSLEMLSGEEEYWVIGRTVDDSWLVVVTPEEIGWSAAWTIEVDGDLTELTIYDSGDTLPESVSAPPTLEATPEPDP